MNARQPPPVRPCATSPASTSSRCTRRPTSRPAAAWTCSASRGPVSVHARHPPLMYRKQPWTMRQYTGFGNAAETNQRFKFLIANGQTGLNVAFDLPTQCGLDSDDPLAEGEIGRVGMAVDTLRDFEVAFDGIDLDAITVSLTINGAARDPDRDVPRDGREARLRHRSAARHRAERHPQGVHRPRHLDLSGRSRRSGWSATPSSTAPSTRPSTARCRSAATTSANPARRRRRRWPMPSASPRPTPTR